MALRKLFNFFLRRLLISRKDKIISVSQSFLQASPLLPQFRTTHFLSLSHLFGLFLSGTLPCVSLWYMAFIFLWSTYRLFCRLSSAGVRSFLHDRIWIYVRSTNTQVIRYHHILSEACDVTWLQVVLVTCLGYCLQSSSTYKFPVFPL